MVLQNAWATAFLYPAFCRVALWYSWVCTTTFALSTSKSIQTRDRPVSVSSLTANATTDANGTASLNLWRSPLSLRPRSRASSHSATIPSFFDANQKRSSFVVKRLFTKSTLPSATAAPPTLRRITETFVFIGLYFIIVIGASSPPSLSSSSSAGSGWASSPASSSSAPAIAAAISASSVESLSSAAR